MSPSKSSRNIDFTNFSTFAKWVFFNHTMNVFFPNFNIFLGVIENSACLLNKRFFAITTQIALVVAFRTIFNKMRRLAMWAIRNFSWLNYFFNLFFWLTEVKKACLSVSDKFSKSCFKMSNSFVTPDMIKFLLVQLPTRNFIKK